MVAASQPLAAQIGLDVLKAGGNAIDAAIATNAALGLMEPTSCGLGGDLFAIVWDAKAKKLYGLNASGRSPYRAIAAAVRGPRARRKFRNTGPLSWSVPGCMDGWAELNRRFGRKPLKDLLAPTIRYAEDGFPVTEVIAGYWQAGAPAAGPRSRIDRDISARTAGRRGPEQVFRNPALAHTLRLIADGGRDAYYRGPIAAELVNLSDKVGGLFTLKDFADHTSTWVEPVSTNYRGYDVWELPPNGQGIAALQMLNILEALRSEESRAEVGRLLAPVPGGEKSRLRRPSAVLRRPGVCEGSGRGIDLQAVRGRTPQADRPPARR